VTDPSRTTGGRTVLARLRGALPSRPSRPSRASVGGPVDAPRVRFTKEDARRLNERFALLDRAERRAIMRAVNRGVPMQRRRDAELAIGVARRQQRFWSRAWLLGPGIALIQILVTPIGWLEGLLLAAWGTLLLGMMAAWWWTRARRAELENLRVVGGRLGRPGSGASTEGGARARRRSRLPGGPPAASPSGARSDADDADGGPAEDDTATPAPRPPRPRGRKRR
jgi:hypothetical protein